MKPIDYPSTPSGDSFKVTSLQRDDVTEGTLVEKISESFADDDLLGSGQFIVKKSLQGDLDELADSGLDEFEEINASFAERSASR